MAATYSTAPSSVAQNKAKTDIKFTAELDEILKRITEIKNIAGVVVVNSEGITVKSTLENSLSVQVSYLELPNVSNFHIFLGLQNFYSADFFSPNFFRNFLINFETMCVSKKLRRLKIANVCMKLFF